MLAAMPRAGVATAARAPRGTGFAGGCGMAGSERDRDRPDDEPSAAAAVAPIDARPILGGLSDLSARAFAGIGDATDEILQLVTTHFGMRTGFVASIEPESNRFVVVAARNEPGGCGVVVGEELNLLDTY